MAKRLVITNGEWTTRHEIGEAAIVIGRDPNCDLFFVNQKLSRRHARVEPGPDGVRLVDLGSRNGIWVNEKKIGEHLLASGDSVRLGGLQIVYEEEDAEPTLELGQIDSTAMLLGGAEVETLKKETDSQLETVTPVVSDVTVLLPKAQEDDDRTVMPRDADSTPDSGAATVILGGGGEPTPAELDVSTRPLPPSDATQRIAGEDQILVPEPEPLAVRVKQSVATLRWQTKFSAALFGLSVLFCALLVWVIGVGSPVALVLFGLLLAGLWARLATVLARKLLVGPVAKLRRDADALENGDSLFLGREYQELDELAKSINRLAGREPNSDREETD